MTAKKTILLPRCSGCGETFADELKFQNHPCCTLLSDCSLDKLLAMYEAQKAKKKTK
jgi:hypothetical protein